MDADAESTAPSTRAGWWAMGDKSPKAKDKAKKQDNNSKNQKQADAKAKANAGGQNAAGKKKG
jgi:hypothetical protein